MIKPHRAAGVVLVVADEDVSLCVLLQLSWQADGDGPNQAIQLILNQHLCQEHIPRCVVLLHPGTPSVIAIFEL